MKVGDLIDKHSGASIRFPLVTRLIMYCPVVGWLLSKRVTVQAEAIDKESGTTTRIAAKARMPYWRCDDITVAFTFPETVSTDVVVQITDTKGNRLYTRNLKSTPAAILGAKCRGGEGLTAGVEYTVRLDERDSTNPRNV